MQYGINRVLNQAKVLLNGNINLEQFEHCSARVPIQSRVQKFSLERNLSTEHENQSPKYACTDLLRWTDR